MKKLKSTLLAVLLAGSVSAQQNRDATVIAVISLGTQNYSIINENGTNDFFKTSPCPVGALLKNESVQIQDVPTNQQLVKVIDPELLIPLFARKIVTANGDDLFPPLDRMPISENEILFFESEEHIQEFYQLVDLYLYGGNAESENDVKLARLEHEFVGFTSYSTYLENKFNISSGKFTLEGVNEIETADFINDDIHKTIFNDERLIGVGDEIYYYYNSNMTLVINKGNSEDLQILEAIQQKEENGGYDLYNDYLFYTNFPDEDTRIISDNYQSKFSGTKGLVVVNPGLSYQTTSIPFWGEVGCDRYTKHLRIASMEEIEDQGMAGFVSVPYTINGTLVIDWKDGFVETISNYIGQQVTHVYSGPGQIYHPTTAFTFLDGYGDPATIIDGDPAGIPIEFNTIDACSRDNREAWDQKIVGNWMMRTKIWAYDNWLGHHVGSYTHSWKNEGGWGLKRATIATFIQGAFRDANCDFKEIQAGDRHRNNSKEVQKSKTKLWGYYSLSNGDVTSYHTLNKSGTSMALSMTLNICP